jgi:hypothetical protein
MGMAIAGLILSSVMLNLVETHHASTNAHVQRLRLLHVLVAQRAPAVNVTALWADMQALCPAAAGATQCLAAWTLQLTHPVPASVVCASPVGARE